MTNAILNVTYKDYSIIWKISNISLSREQKEHFYTLYAIYKISYTIVLTVITNNY